MTENNDTDETTYTVQINGREIKNAKIQSLDSARGDAAEIRENAPDRVRLTDGMVCDIDDVIAALEEARDRGVETVYVNDDGQTYCPRPVITNNHRQYTATKPEPDELREWVEL
jgi:hypothetical protein